MNDTEILKLQNENAELKYFLRLAVNDINALVNAKSPRKCANLISFNRIEFMGGILNLENTWIHAKEAEKILTNCN